VKENKDSGETWVEALDRNQTKEEDGPLFSATFLLNFSLALSEQDSIRELSGKALWHVE
jgi:hypothetical protein